VSSSAHPLILTVSLIVAAVGAVLSTRDYRRKSRLLDTQFAEMMRALEEVAKLPSVPGSQRFRSDPAMRSQVQQQLADLTQRARTDRTARLALGQLVADELVLLDQRAAVLAGVPEQSQEDRDELAAIPATRVALEALLATVKSPPRGAGIR
jgi:hypothetical protein